MDHRFSGGKSGEKRIQKSLAFKNKDSGFLFLGNGAA
jgi:hypothetical protein